MVIDPSGRQSYNLCMSVVVNSGVKFCGLNSFILFHDQCKIL